VLENMNKKACDAPLNDLPHSLLMQQDPEDALSEMRRAKEMEGLEPMEERVKPSNYRGSLLLAA